MVTTTKSVFGALPTGAKLVSVGHFADARKASFVAMLADSSYVLVTLTSNGLQTVPVTVPSGYSVIGAGQFDNIVVGFSQVLLRNQSGNLAYGSYNVVTKSFDLQTIGNPGTSWSVVAEGPFASWYNGSHQIALDSLQNGNHVLWLYGKQPQLTLPNGFKAVGAGNFFGSDLSGVLIQNGAGVLEVVFQAQETNGTQPVDLVITTLGTLQADSTVVAVSNDAAAATVNILVQNAGTLSELIVHEAAIVDVVQLGTIPSATSVAGFVDLNGDSAPDILFMTNTGTVEVQAGTPTALSIGSLAVPGAPAAAIVLGGAYGQTTNTGHTRTLSDILAQLASGQLAAAGVTLLKMEAGTLAECSFEQVAAGNITFAAWQQNVVTLNAIALLCRQQGIAVQVEASLWFNGYFLAATEQWLQPAVAAGLPIAYVEDNSEPDPRTLNWTSAAQNGLQTIAEITAAYPNAKFGQWVVLGSDNVTDGYHMSLQGWWSTFNKAAAAAGLPGISYAVADQFYGPVWDASASRASATGQAPGQETLYSMFKALVATAKASNVAVEMSATSWGSFISRSQLLARAVLEISQETSPNVAAVQLDYSANWLPVSGAVNTPGSALNLSAIIAAIEPLYRAGKIRTTNAVAIGLPTQFVVRPNTATSIGTFVLTSAQSDSSNPLAVVLITQSGSLSISNSTGVSLSTIGSNILVINGTAAAINAALTTLRLTELLPGPDAIDFEVFGSSGRIGGGVVYGVSTNAPTGGTFLPTAQLGWQSASATIVNGKITTETFSWNKSNGLSSSKFIGGATIAPIVELPIHQPLLQSGLAVVNGKAAMSASFLQFNSGGWNIYDPLQEGGWTTEVVNATVASSKLMYDPTNGVLQRREDTLLPTTYAGLFPYSDAGHPFYLANGGLAVTNWNVPNNPYWTTSLYANGANGVIPIVNGFSLILASGNTTLMAVGSVQTIYGFINGSQRVIEVKYHGGLANPYDEIDQIFNPYSATPVLWQQIQTVAIPAALADNTPLPVPTAETTIEYNTGDNPNWSDNIWISPDHSISVAGYKAVATTIEEGVLDAQVEITASGVVTAQRGVTWIDEATILSEYTLSPPTISGYGRLQDGRLELYGSGIIGNLIVISDINGQKLGGTQVAATGNWRFDLPGNEQGVTSYSVTAQQFDLAADSSPASAQWLVYSALPNTVQAENPALHIWFQNDNGQLARWTVKNTGISSGTIIPNNPGPAWYEVAVGGFYAGNNSDVLWQNIDGEVAVWQMQETNLLGVSVIADPGPSWHVDGVGKFYKDGNNTILFQNDNGAVALWRVQDGALTGGAIVASNPGPSWHIKGTGDFYKDGNTDILWQNDNGAVALWDMNGATIIKGEIVAANPGSTWRIKGTGDFYGDGNVDILWQNDNGAVALWDMNGATIVRGAVVTAEPGPTWHIKDVADFNADGKADITWQADDGSVAVWEMNGSDIVGGAILANPGSAWRVAGSDNMRFVYSAAANETLSGSPVEPDEFVLTNIAAGAHTIVGFNPVQDVVEFGRTMFSSFDAVLAATTETHAGSLVHVGGATVLLAGVDIWNLHASDFALA
jgi:hypothetical protein